MTPQDPPRQGPTLVFDGDCGFCTASVLWLRARLRPAVSESVETEPWQTLAAEDRLAEFGLTEAETSRWVWWVERAGSEVQRWRGHRAVGKTLRASRGPWPLLGTLLLVPPPLSWPLAAGYRLVATLRGHLPGTRPACKRERWPPS